MGFILGAILVMGGFAVMSRTSRIAILVLFVGSLIYGYTISEVFHDRFISSGELRLGLTLISANTGAFLLATVLGVVRKSSGSELDYRAKKMALFKFIGKWGAIYALYSFIGGRIISFLYDDPDAGWLLMRVFGLYGFVPLMLIFFLLKRKKRSSRSG